eukprot:CAMPEP_0171306424 /NCGR_PEP_ID=MMETSP0816-20121228/16436_1 /TAXON_ID=420281 /ORGANISM="Proboscia inermis, Strain CCAP1064/1" /LENGTH=138 /DNA_ID=CAMNT_0011787991 /DNA_START=13 /DNA_END=429 /DNA_ORIENTATION=-
MAEDTAAAASEKVRQIHSNFDSDNDNFLNLEELSALQFETSGNTLDKDQYVMVCRALGCHPGRGISLEALKLTYAAEGTDVNADYEKVFSERSGDNSISKAKKSKTTIISSMSSNTDGNDVGEEDVLEVGENGVDISR